MNDDGKVSVWLVIVALAAGLIVGLCVGWKVNQDIIQAELVKRGVGEWKVVDQYGHTEFMYISIENAPKH
jgi:hypothetical protein